MRLVMPLLCLPVLAALPEGVPEGFLLQPPSQLMVAATDKARVMAAGRPEVLAQAAEVYLAAGQRDRALDALARLLATAPKDPRPGALAVEVWLRSGQVPEALKALQALPTATPKAAAAPLLRTALSLLDHDCRTEADALAERAWKADLSRTATALDYGCALLARGHQADAAPWIEKALARDPKDAQTWGAIAEAARRAAQRSATPKPQA